MNQMMRAGVVTAFAATIAVCGLARADENPLSEKPGAATSDKGPAPASAPKDNGAATPATNDTTMAPAVLVVYPMAETARPLQLPKDVVEAGATIAIQDGVGTGGSYALGNWIGFDLRGDYGVTDKIQAGVRIPLLLGKPDLSGGVAGGPSAAVFGGFVLDGMYSINEMASAHVDVGITRPEGIPFNDAVYPIYNIAGLKAGIRAGAAVKKRFMDGKLAVFADPALAIQQDAAPNGSGGSKTFFGLRVPVTAMYQLKPALAAGVRTGIYTGADFSFSGNDGASIPFLLEGQYTTMNGNLDLGADLGFASFLTRSGQTFDATVAPYDSVGDSLYFGLYGAWRMAGLSKSL